MATALCSNKTGQMTAVNVGGASTALFRISGLPLAEGIVTRVELSANIAAQFQNAFNDTIYVVPFGDAVGEMRITVLAKRVCDRPEALGVGTLIAAYKAGRLRPSRSQTLVKASIDGAAFAGYLVGMTFGGNADNTGSTSTVTFVLKVWPP